MSEVILALDPARKTGVALGVPGGRPLLVTINFSRELDDPEDIFARAMAWINRALDGSLDIASETPFGPPAVLAIEAPIPPSNKFGSTTFDTTLISLGLSAIFRGAARARGVPIKLAHIGAWRKYAIGIGNLEGKIAKQMMVRLCRGLGWGDNVSVDEADAAGIFLWASGQLNPRLATRPEPLLAGVAR
jgi:hypothetical protein